MSEIKDLLRKGVPDEDMIEATSRASPSEEERTATQIKTKSKANKAYEVALFENSTVSKLLPAVKNLTNQVGIVQSEMNEFNIVNRTGNYYQCDNYKRNN